ncbi:ATP-dependent helicase HrpB [Salmonella enterica subsp. arizonae]|uniref:ATP-dependent helicase HrpB n=1 Tax=Salmonella enterica subsp. arizonae TaxID=59203 RepID=A0A379TIQ2_SALER|nr:ATP-dependent helicase HrpB [Salmonella enterica subsp. arizonae]
MLQCGAKKVNPVEPFVTSLPVAAVLPELLTALKNRAAGFVVRAYRGGKIYLAAAANSCNKVRLLEKFSCLNRVVWRRVMSRSVWRKG